jgi:gamma-glutamyltranspeptidase / glutathione hydrolase
MAQRGGTVACGHDATASAAVEVLHAGGSAFDAAIAAISCACVAEPVLASLGGGGYLLAQPAGERPRVFDFFAHTPSRRLGDDDHDFRPVLADFGTTTQEFHIGAGSVAVPGMVAGMFDIHRALGKLPMRDLLAPSIALANDGVTVRPFDAHVLGVVGAIFNSTPGCANLFSSPSVDESLLQTGDAYRCPDLADCLDALASEGEDLFYRGEISGLVASSVESGGHLRRRDLERYEVRQHPALSLNYGNATVATNPPPASGGVLIAFALHLLDQIDLGQMEPGTSRPLDALAKVMSLMAKARERGATVESGIGGEAILAPQFLAPFLDEIKSYPLARAGTTHISIIDGEGNVAAATLSNGESCGIVVPGTGILLNNMLGEEDLHPGRFNRWTVDTRMTSMMAPTVVRKRDGSCIATGSGGSNRIRSAIVQVLVNLLNVGMDVDEAVNFPRIHLEKAHLSIEHGIEVERIGELLEKWPQHQLWNERSMFFGGAHTVVMSRDGATRGTGDERRGGVCISA